MLRTVALLGFIALASCDSQAPGYARLGVRPEGSSVLIRYLPCPGEVVKAARLYQLDGDTVAPDEGDTLLWQRTGSDLASIGESGVLPLVGDEPFAFEPKSEYFIEVESTKNLVDTGAFTIDDLDIDKVRVNFRNLSEAEFVADADASC